MDTPIKPKPVYTTNGDCKAMLLSRNLFNLSGEWIGWLTPDNEVYDVNGIYVGRLSDDMRILRKRSLAHIERRDVPDPPKPIRAPATIPLPPLMAELPFSEVDVLDEEPDRLHTMDTGELKEDMN
jgi:hypothetical protein